MNTNDSILIIDDELQIRRLLEITLNSEGYRTITAANAKEGLLEAATNHPSIVIIDLGLPDMDGIELISKLREWYTKPIIVLSVISAEETIIKALDQGANDYLTKPFRSGELLARIRAAIRSAGDNEDIPVLEAGALTIDLVNHIAKKNHIPVRLTSTEFSLLKLLAMNQGRVLTHQYILREVWGYNYINQSQYLRVFIGQLRKKIEDNPAHPTYIITESGIGYRFSE